MTAREREILDLEARGHHNAGISGRLFLSPNTVRNDISRVFAKLGFANRAQAIFRPWGRARQGRNVEVVGKNGTPVPRQRAPGARMMCRL